MDRIEYRKILLERTRVQTIFSIGINDNNPFEELAEFDKALPKEQIRIVKEYEEKNKRRSYIEKNGDDFKYLGTICHLSKTTDWFNVFHELFQLAPNGGRATYTVLGELIKKRIKKTRKYTSKEMIRFIQRNLTDKSNGFMHYAKIKKEENNGKPLIYIERSNAVIFNNGDQ